jgi:hypothetical protein
MPPWSEQSTCDHDKGQAVYRDTQKDGRLSPKVPISGKGFIMQTIRSYQLEDEEEVVDNATSR